MEFYGGLLDTEDKVATHFKDVKYMYFVTIKPPRDQNKLKQVIDFCQKYLNKKHSCRFWIVPSISDTDYFHYHGILGLSADPKYDDHKIRERFKSAIQRKVNRDIGFNHPLQRVDNLPKVNKYIQRQRATDYEFREDVSIDTKYL